MKISRTDTNPLNSVITIKIERNDFEEKVSKILNDYREKANIPGFRKGHVPIGMIKKQYETAVTAEEVNKLLQENLENISMKKKLISWETHFQWQWKMISTGNPRNYLLLLS